MAVTGDLVLNARMNSESYQTGSVAISADACQTVSDTIVAGAANNAVAISAFLTAKCEGLYLSGTENMTVIFVGTGNTGNLSVTLVEDTFEEWHNGSWVSNPVANNCVAVLATNATANNATLTARVWTNA
jgi:hypothetical protein